MNQPRRTLHRTAQGAVQQPAQTPTTPATPATPSTGFEWPSKESWFRLAISFVLPIIVYAIVYNILRHYNVGIFLSHLIGYALSLMFLAYLDSALKSPSSMGTAVFIMLTLIFFLELSINFIPGLEKKRRAQDSSNGTQRFELVEIKEPGKTYITKTAFSKGQRIKIVVTGNAYQTDGADWEKPLDEGEHYETMTGDGNMAFKADSTATVKIVY